MQNGNLLISSIALVAVAGLTIVTLAASYYPLFSGGTIPPPPASTNNTSTATAVTELGKTVVTSTQQWPVDVPPKILTGTIYKTSASSQGLTFTMEYNGTSIRLGETIVFRLTLQNENNTSGSVGVHTDLAPWSIVISNSSGPVDGVRADYSNDPIVALKPGDKISKLVKWDNTIFAEDPKTNQLIRLSMDVSGTYQFTGEVTALDTADGHPLFTIKTQPVTIEVLPS